jgi:hypothetical protein
VSTLLPAVEGVMLQLAVPVAEVAAAQLADPSANTMG